MPVLLSRRVALSGGALILFSNALKAQASPSQAAFSERLAALEARTGGRLGVAVFDSGGGQRLAWRADERFPMCSTFKFVAAAAILARVDDGKDDLARMIPYGAADLLGYAPVTKAHLDGGGMSRSVPPPSR